MDINEIFQKELAKLDIQEMFQNTMRAQIEETVRKCLKDAVGTYSSFSKAFEKVVEENLTIDPSRISLPQYNQFVTERALEVINEFMSEQRASEIRKTLTQRLAPHLEKEIQFDNLIAAIEEALIETYEPDECACEPVEYTIKCEKEERSYGANYWKLSVFEGDEKDYNHKMASLYLSGEDSYHSDGPRRDPIAKRFASYAFNKTKVLRVNEYRRKITVEDAR